MKRKHRLTKLLLTVLLLACLIPALNIDAAAAPITGTCGDSITWTLQDGVLTLVGSGAMYDYDYDYGKVYDYTKAKAPWAKYTPQITSVKADATITHIGEMAFFHCSKLQSLELPGVLTVGKRAFEGCTYLNKVSLPAAVTVEDHAFSGCTRLTAVDVPAVVSVGADAFSGTAIQSASMPAAKFIGKNAFSDCTHLTAIHLPAAENIGNNAFSDCRSLTAANLPAAKSVGEAAFSECHKLSSVSLPKATALKKNVFLNCIALTSVDFPAVLAMDTGAFAGCTGLTAIRMSALTAVPAHGFELLTGLVSADLPSAVVLSEYAFNACKSLRTVNLPAVMDLQPHAFRHCTSLTSASFPQIRVIPNYCFYGCKNLKNVDIEYATHIGNFAFQECTALKIIDFPYATHIGDCAFYQCSALTEAYIPAVKTIEMNGFNHCSALQLLSISTDLELVKARAFEACSSLKSIYVQTTKVKWEPLSVAGYNNEYFLQAECIFDTPPFFVDPLPDTISVAKTLYAKLTVSAHGSGLRYQWQLCPPNSSSWIDISGANAASVAYGPVSLSEDGSKLRCKVTNRSGDVLLSEEVLLTVTPFADIDTKAYYHQPVLWAVDKGITTGTGATTFSPNTACTRGQVVTFMWRAAGKSTPENTSTVFTDIPADAYYREAVLWAVEQGITTGTGATTFSPDAPCTRAQIVTLLWRAANCPDMTDTDNPFADVVADSYYADAVLWAADKGITNGTTATTFSPDAPCTRAQIVTFLYRNR